MKKKLLLAFSLMGAAMLSQAQTKIGGAAGAPNKDAYLQLGDAGGNKGLLLSRVTLTSTTSASPLSAHVAGMTVYNTATAGDVTPGYYYNDGTKWVRIGSSSSSSEPWFDMMTNKASASNTDSVYILGRAMVGAITPARVATDASSSPFVKRFGYFTVVGGDASINGVTVGKGGSQDGSNTAIGSGVLQNNNGGLWNTAVGSGALQSNTTGNDNTALGINALQANTTGKDNTALGTVSLYSNTTGTNNTGVGVSTLRNNTTGSHNSALGEFSLQSNTTGNSNTGVGDSTLTTNTTGFANTALGSKSLLANTTGWWNVALGTNALSSNTTGVDNTALGTFSGALNTNGGENVAIGASALRLNTTGSNNTTIGTGSLRNVIGSNNTALGFGAGSNQTAGANNIMIGASTDVPSLTGSNQMNIGNLVYGTGMTGNGAGNLGIGTNAPNADAYLQLGNAGGNKGLLLSRVALTSTTAAAPLSAHVAGMHVYNTASAGAGATAVTPGEYYSDGTQWVRVGTGTEWLFDGTATDAGGDKGSSISRSGYVSIASGGPALSLKAGPTADHVYMRFYARSANQSVQSGWLGYGSTGPDMLLVNSLTGGKISLNTSGGNVVVDQSGNLGIGTSTPATKLHVKNGALLLNASGSAVSGSIWQGTASEDGVWIDGVSMSGQRRDAANLFLSKPAGYTDGTFTMFLVNGSAVGSITYNASTLAVNYNSDKRLKENIVSSHYGIADVMKMSIYDYNYKADTKKTLNTGVLAQDLYNVVPQAVKVGGDDEKTNPWQVDYSKLVPVLIKAVQEQQAQIEDLKQQVAELKAAK